MPEYRWNQTEMAAGYDAGAEWIHPHYREIQDTLLTSIPFGPGDTFHAVDLGGGSGRFAERFLERFPRATITVVDQSEPFLEITARRLAPFPHRWTCVVSQLQQDWERRISGPVQALFSMSAIHHLDAGEKRDLYRRCAARLESGGVFLNGDEVRPVRDDEYRVLLGRWWTHMQSAMAAGRIAPPMAAGLEKWKARNIDRFSEPRVSGDDCHETAAAQISTFREVGLAHSDIPWQQDLWAVLRGGKA